MFCEHRANSALRANDHHLSFVAQPCTTHPADQIPPLPSGCTKQDTASPLATLYPYKDRAEQAVQET